MNLENCRPAREVGLVVLDRFASKPDDAAGILRQHIDRTPERSLLTDLVFGVIRNRICIDNIIAHVSGLPVAHVSRQVINLLRIGIYELVYCPDREAYAIVSEAMKQTAGLGEKQKGFVNAILRKTCRLMVERGANLADSPAKMTIPIGPEKGCRFSMEVLADPKERPGQYLSVAFSLPGWLVEGWIREFGFDRAMQICLGSNRRPSVYARVNTLKTTPAEVLGAFRAEEVECETVADNELSILVKGGRAIEKLPGYGQGWFSVQDLTAAEPVRLLVPQAGEKVLDLCAAPGGKAIQMAEMMGDKGQIWATDIDAQRLKLVGEGVARMGVQSVKVFAYNDLEKVAAEVGGFDAVMLDVPCSNTGVMARRCEVRYRMTAKQVAGLAKTQAGILAHGARFVKPGGRICYSTCSICAAENTNVVRGFLGENPGWELAAEKLTLPSAARIDRDGGYAAVLKKL